MNGQQLTVFPDAFPLIPTDQLIQSHSTETKKSTYYSFQNPQITL
jgi:hypothetical protein